MFKLFLMGTLAHIGMFSILHRELPFSFLNNRGEAGAETPKKPVTPPVENPALSQDHVNSIIKREVAKVEEKYAGYNDLAKFKQDHEADSKKLEESKLEETKEYNKLKDNWGTKEKEYQGQISAKDAEIKSIKIDNELTNAVMKYGAFPEAAKLIRDLVKASDDGSITISGKNEQGIDSDLTVDQGVKNFLKEKPWLVKATGSGGAGTLTAGEVNNVGNNTDPMADANELQAAIRSGDRKKIMEVKAKIGAKRAKLVV